MRGREEKEGSRMLWVYLLSLGSDGVELSRSDRDQIEWVLQRSFLRSSSNKEYCFPNRKDC